MNMNFANPNTDKLAPKLIGLAQAYISADSEEDYIPQARELAQTMPFKTTLMLSVLNETMICMSVTQLAHGFAQDTLKTLKDDSPEAKKSVAAAGQALSSTLSVFFGLDLTEEKIREMYTAEKHEKLKALVERDGADAYVAKLMRNFEFHRKMNPLGAKLAEAIACDPRTQLNYEDTLKDYYTNIFPQMSYDEAIAQKLENVKNIPVDKIDGLISETFDKLTPEQFLSVYANFIDAAPLDRLAHTVYEGKNLLLETVAFLKTNKGANRLPSPLSNRLADYQNGLTGIAGALWKATDNAGLQIIDRFNEVVEATRANKLASLPPFEEKPTKPQKEIAKRHIPSADNV